MTTEEKLIALGFKECMVEDTYVKSYSDGNFFIAINFNVKNKIGFIKNVYEHYYKDIESFKNLLIWDAFYEKKQSKRAISRYESTNDSEAQNDIQRA